MNQIEGVFRLPITIAVSISGIALFWFGANFMSKTKIRGNEDIKLIKVLLYTAITVGTMYDFLWKHGSNTLLNLFIYLVSFFEIYSNADDIIFLFRSRKKLIRIGDKEYKVRISRIDE